MTIDGKKILNKLARLRQVTNIKDVPQLTHGLFPGTHCPLMGAAMAIGGIEDALMVVVGTDECAYYNKSMTIGSSQFGGIEGRCVSVVLDAHDVTFGSLEHMQQDFEELVQEYHPSCVFLVTTCVIEVIGDDYDALAASLSEKYQLPVMAVHTEHFKCEDHLPGLERTITACLEMMETCPCNDSVNILGQRLGIFSTTELYRELQEAKVNIGLQLPSGCTVEAIKKAPQAKVNIVVHDIALPLAEKMQEKFGIPYVFFNRFLNPEKTMSAYQELFQYLELPLPKSVEENYTKTKATTRQMQGSLAGIPYIYGNTPYAIFELNAYLASLGMIPKLIQTGRLTEKDAEDIHEIVQHGDPYICKSANISPLQYVYDELDPYLYMGHEFAGRLKKKGIAVVHADMANALLGFETTNFFLGQCCKAVEEAKQYRRELNKL